MMNYAAPNTTLDAWLGLGRDPLLRKHVIESRRARESAQAAERLSEEVSSARSTGAANVLPPLREPAPERAMGTSTRIDRQRGASSVLFMVALPSFLMLIWACVEIGNITSTGTRARSGADGIALAAAARYWSGREQAVIDAGVVAAASSLSLVVSPTGTSGDVQFGDWDASTQTFTARESGGRAVRVVVQYADGHPNGAVPGILPVALGPGAVRVSRAAVAVYCPPRDQTSLLLVGRDPTLLELTDSANLSMDGLIGLQGDGTSVVTQPSASLRAPALELSSLLATLATHENFDADVFAEVVFAGDPYAALVLPQPGAPIPVAPSGGVTTVAPGTHSGLSSTTESFVLSPGDHVFTGPIDLGGTASLTLDGARIVLASGGTLRLYGSAQLIGAAPPVNVDSARAWLATRENDAAMLLEQLASVTVDGLLYAPAAHMQLRGDASLECSAAILGSFGAGDLAVASLTDRITPLDREPVPGRARLVK